MTGYRDEDRIEDTNKVVGSGGPAIPREAGRGGGEWIRRWGLRGGWEWGREGSRRRRDIAATNK